MTEFEISYRGAGIEPGQRPPAPEPWVHGVPPLRPSTRRGDRMPTRGGRRYSDIYLAEDDDYAGEIGLHFDGAVSGTTVNLTMADFLNLQAAVTDPAKPVTARQVQQYLRELAASFPADGFGATATAAAYRTALGQVVKMLEET